jgi:hypothetical protein
MHTAWLSGGSVDMAVPNRTTVEIHDYLDKRPGVLADMCDPGRCLTPWFWFPGDTLRTRFR